VSILGNSWLRLFGLLGLLATIGCGERGPSTQSREPSTAVRSYSLRRASSAYEEAIADLRNAVTLVPTGLVSAKRMIDEALRRFEQSAALTLDEDGSYEWLEPSFVGGGVTAYTGEWSEHDGDICLARGPLGFFRLLDAENRPLGSPGGPDIHVDSIPCDPGGRWLVQFDDGTGDLQARVVIDLEGVGLPLGGVSLVVSVRLERGRRAPPVRR
jgi:hypothetical protein